MSEVRVAIVGVGNCASSLVQGVEYYKDADPKAQVPGLMHVQFGDYHVRDVKFVVAFDVDANIYGQFIDFLKDKDYGYETESEKALNAFKETAVRERYFDRISAEYEQLLTKKKSVKRKDLSMFQSEISRYLRMEIVSRYGYRRARIRSSLFDDPMVIQALLVLQDEKRYQSILSPQFTIPDALEVDEGTTDEDLLPEIE